MANTPAEYEATNSEIIDYDSRCDICMVAYGSSAQLQEDGPITPPEQALLFPDCGHTIGSTCARLWFESTLNPSCPLCRQPKCSLCNGELINEPRRFDLTFDDSENLLTLQNTVEILCCQHRFHHACLEEHRMTSSVCPNGACGSSLHYLSCQHEIPSRVQNHWRTPVVFERPQHEQCLECYVSTVCAEEANNIKRIQDEAASLRWVMRQDALYTAARHEEMSIEELRRRADVARTHQIEIDRLDRSIEVSLEPVWEMYRNLTEEETRWLRW